MGRWVGHMGGVKGGLCVMDGTAPAYDMGGGV